MRNLEEQIVKENEENIIPFVEKENHLKTDNNMRCIVFNQINMNRTYEDL